MACIDANGRPAIYSGKGIWFARGVNNHCSHCWIFARWTSGLPSLLWKAKAGICQSNENSSRGVLRRCEAHPAHGPPCQWRSCSSSRTAPSHAPCPSCACGAPRMCAHAAAPAHHTHRVQVMIPCHLCRRCSPTKSPCCPRIKCSSAHTNLQCRACSRTWEKCRIPAHESVSRQPARQIRHESNLKFESADDSR